MGCHTWSYKKVKSLSNEEKINFLNKAIEDVKNWWGFTYSTDKLIQEVKDWYIEQPRLFNVESCGEPEKYAIDMLKEYTAKRDNLISGGFDYWLNNIAIKEGYPVCFVHDGDVYVNIGFDDPFRLYGFPEEEFTDCEEMINWITKTKQSVSYCTKNENGEKIKINRFDDECAKRIRDYFEKHGKDTLLFDFG